MKKKLLVICDVKNWAFDRIYQGLNKYCEEWQVDAFYLNERNKQVNLNSYDLIYNLPDNFLGHIQQWYSQGLNPNKVVQGIRSEVNLPIYEKSDMLNSYFRSLLCSNDKLFKRFEFKHRDVYLAEGGVDTDFYSYKKRKAPKNKVRVGWAGSTGVFDRNFRGLDIIQSACNLLDFEFVPALKEIRQRTPDEMVKYYHNEIDIYVEMSKSAGRQNGLVEAGSCGVPIISNVCGIAQQLIEPGINGLLSVRNVDDLKLALEIIMSDYEYFSKNVRESIEHEWSWKVQAKKFEAIFNNIIKA